MADSLDQLRDRLRAFADERDWGRFHTAKNLAMAVAGEAGELVAELQWHSDNEILAQLRLIRDQQAGHVLDALGVTSMTSAEQELNDARQAARELADDVGEEARLPPEQTHSSGGSYLLSEREVVFRRVESLLVLSYKDSLPSEATTDRIRCKAGLTDLCVATGGSTEVLEAKADASHPYVRQALGQILDYTHAITTPITTIAALFPSRPSNDDIALLNHYGVDCVYRSAPGAFSREAANPSRRLTWKQTT